MDARFFSDWLPLILDNLVNGDGTDHPRRNGPGLPDVDHLEPTISFFDSCLIIFL